MRLVGLAMCVGGWLIAVAGLFAATSNAARAVVALIGIAVSLGGSVGVINKYYLDRAIWKQ